MGQMIKVLKRVTFVALFSTMFLVFIVVSQVSGFSNSFIEQQKELMTQIDNLEQKNQEYTNQNSTLKNELMKSYSVIRNITSSKPTESSRNNEEEPLEVAKVIAMRGTGYTLSVQSCGKSIDHPLYGITKSGKRATTGKTVAVDPKVIPLGSIVYIVFPKKYEFLNGYYTAEDTGSAVKGNTIDIFLGEDRPGEDTIEKMTNEFGVQKVVVHVMKKGKIPPTKE